MVGELAGRPSQAVEFLDIPPMGETLTDPPDAARRSDPIRTSLATAALEYIEGLVGRYHGDVDDVRSVIGALDAGSARIEAQ